ncbi:MAG: tetratricopeptide repeat protein [Treponema sp.]
MNTKKIIIGLLVLTCAVLFFPACRNRAFLRQLQDMELGVKNPSSIEDLQSAISKYQGKIDDIITMEHRTGIWYKILGRRYMDKKMYKKAIESFQHALEYFPENQHVFYQIGVCAAILAKSTLDYPNMSSGERQAYFDLSVSAYKRAVELDPNYTRAVYALSVLYVFELNRPADAIAIMEPLAAKEKKPLDSLFILGRAYYMTGQYEKAIAAYDRIIKTSGSAEQRADAERNKAFVQNARGS